MTVQRLPYRLAQFWRLAFPCLDALPLDQVFPYLSPAQQTLFRRMSAGEQAHAIRVWQRLIAAGARESALLLAALLHDVGKILYPLSVWERAIVVLAQSLAPEQWRRWGRGEARGWRKPFVVAVRHADWGATLAAQAGAPPLAVLLISYHHTPPAQAPRTLAPLLAALQQADDNS